MLNKLKNKVLRHLPYSLKYRLLVILCLSTLLPLILLGSVSYYTIDLIQKNKVESGIQSSLNQLGIELVGSINSLNYASQQIAFEGNVRDNLVMLFSTENLLQKAQLAQEISDQLRLISYTNIQLGLLFFYSPNEERPVSFENLMVRNFTDLVALPVLSRKQGVVYMGPHKSLSIIHNSGVFSIMRRLDINDTEMYVCIETNNEFLEDIFGSLRYAVPMRYFIVNNESAVIYSEDEESFPLGSKYAPGSEARTRLPYYIFRDEEENEYGFKILAGVLITDFNREVNAWFFKFLIVTILSLGFSILFAFIIWRTIYRPVKMFNKEMERVEKSDFTSPIQIARSKEFDALFMRFNRMALSIKELINQVERKEKQKRQLEAERLRYKINPHFLNNTLDTVRWMARMAGHEEIDSVVSSLNSVLHYNLAKKGDIATIGEELEIIVKYFGVQLARFDFEYEIIISDEKDLRSVPIPRFLLQPLVENALRHGMRDGLVIVLAIAPTGRGVIIEVRDNGIGMSAKVLEGLTSGNAINKGAGIGVAYVQSMLEAHYGENAVLEIDSKEGAGTVFRVRLPDCLPVASV